MRVIDFSDDLGASFIAAGVEPPEVLKTASAVEPYEKKDRDFALLIVDDRGKTHRKFACDDPGNTWMSLWYLENVDNGLPKHANALAAKNLYQISQDFGLTDDLLCAMFPKSAAMAAAAGQKIEHGKLAGALLKIAMNPANLPTVAQTATMLGIDIHALFPLTSRSDSPNGGYHDLPLSQLKVAEATNAPSLSYNHDTGEFDSMIDPWGQRKTIEDAQRDPSSILWFHHAAENFEKTDGEHEHFEQLRPAVERLLALLDQIEAEHNSRSDNARGQALQAMAAKHGIPEEEIEQHVAPGGQHAAEFQRMHRAFGAQAPQDGKPQKGSTKKAAAPHVIGAGLGWFAGSRLGAKAQPDERKKTKAALVLGGLGAAGGAFLGEGFVQHRNRAAANKVIDDFFASQAGLKVGAHPDILDERRVRVHDKAVRSQDGGWGKQASAEKQSAFDKVASLDAAWDRMEPYDRRVAALGLEDVASVVEIPEKIRGYMGRDVGPNLKIAMEARATRVARDPESAENYIRVAAMAKVGSLAPEDAVEAIHLLDEGNGLSIPGSYGPRIPDPYRCVYGLHKQAMWSWTHAGQYVNENDLRLFAAAPASKDTLEQLFNDDLVTKFRDKPVETFKGMPREQQMVVARAATQSGYRDTGGLGT